MTIYEALKLKLKREPTHRELCDEVNNNLFYRLFDLLNEDEKRTLTIALDNTNGDKNE
jgi:hypothetical protein